MVKGAGGHSGALAVHLSRRIAQLKPIEAKHILNGSQASRPLGPPHVFCALVMPLSWDGQKQFGLPPLARLLFHRLLDAAATIGQREAVDWNK